MLFAKLLLLLAVTGASYFLNKSEPKKVVQELPEEKLIENIPQPKTGSDDIGNGTWLDL